MNIFTLILAAILFTFLGFVFGFLIAAMAHSNIMRGIADGNRFQVGEKKYRAVEVDE